MPQLSYAGQLLLQLDRRSPPLCDAVALGAGVALDRADAAMTGGERLTLAEQLRVAEATTIIAPEFARQASRLRLQALASRSYIDAEDVERHREAPPELWERSRVLRG